jgi:hypothetical protein
MLLVILGKKNSNSKDSVRKKKPTLKLDDKKNIRST